MLAIGNAPTALFRLLELIDDGAPTPAAVLGGPVGFVGSAQSKQELIDAAARDVLSGGDGPPRRKRDGRRGRECDCDGTRMTRSPATEEHCGVSASAPAIRNW